MALRHHWHLFALIVVGVGLSLTGCAFSQDDGSLARVRDKSAIVVGVDPSYPPFAYLDDQGRPVGYEIDLANAVASRLGVSAEFVGIDVGGIVDSLLARKVDAVISGLYPDASYGKRIAFSRPYFNNGQVLISRSVVLTNLADLTGRNVAVESGSNADIELRKRAPEIPDLRIKPFTTIDLAFDALRLDKVDAAVSDAATAIEFAGRNAGFLAGTPFTAENYSVALRAGDDSLLTAVNAAVEGLVVEGHLAALQTKWLR